MYTIAHPQYYFPPPNFKMWHPHYPYLAAVASTGPNMSDADKKKEQHKQTIAEKKKQKHKKDLDFLKSLIEPLKSIIEARDPDTGQLQTGAHEFDIKIEAINDMPDELCLRTSFVADYELHGILTSAFRLSITDGISDQKILVYFEAIKDDEDKKFDEFIVHKVFHRSEEITTEAFWLRHMAEMVLLFFCCKCDAIFVTTIQGRHENIPTKYFYSKPPFQSENVGFDDHYTVFEIKIEEQFEDSLLEIFAGLFEQVTKQTNANWKW